MYFTRSVAKRLKVNQGIRDHAAETVDVDDYFDTITEHEDWDEDVEEWDWVQSDRWVDTMEDMTNNMTFDVDTVKKLHPERYWGYGYAMGVTEHWAEKADLKKLTWIYKEIIKNPLCLIK